MLKQKGITLIALVITIIIMLILVAVTIKVAIDGGLIEKAKEGETKTKIEAEKERLLDIAMGQYDEKTGIVNLEEVKKILNEDIDKFKGEAKIEGDKLTVTGKDGVVYTLYKNGIIQDSEINNTESNSSESYVGKCYMSHDEKPTVSHAYLSILCFADENTAICFWAEYMSGDDEPLFEIDQSTGKFINCRIDDSYELKYQEVITKDDARFIQKCKDLNLDTSNFADTVLIEESSGEDYYFIVFSPNYDKICGFWTDIDYSEPFIDPEDIYTVTTDPIILEKVKNYK